MNLSAWLRERAAKLRVELEASNPTATLRSITSIRIDELEAAAEELECAATPMRHDPEHRDSGGAQLPEWQRYVIDGVLVENARHEIVGAIERVSDVAGAPWRWRRYALPPDGAQLLLAHVQRGGGVAPSMTAALEDLQTSLADRRTVAAIELIREGVRDAEPDGGTDDS